MKHTMVVILACAALAGCATKRNEFEPSALVRISCPELDKFTEEEKANMNMGSMAIQWIKDANQYDTCRRAALGITK